MRPTASLMTKVADDLAIVPASVIALETGVHGEAWGVCVFTTSRGTADDHFFRPAEENTRDSARDLLATWIRWTNTGEEEA